MRRAFPRASIAVEVRDHETPPRHEALSRNSAGRRPASGRRPGAGLSTARLGVAAVSLAGQAVRQPASDPGGVRRPADRLPAPALRSHGNESSRCAFLPQRRRHRRGGRCVRLPGRLRHGRQSTLGPDRRPHRRRADVPVLPPRLGRPQRPVRRGPADHHRQGQGEVLPCPSGGDRQPPCAQPPGSRAPHSLPGLDEAGRRRALHRQRRRASRARRRSRRSARHARRRGHRPSGSAFDRPLFGPPAGPGPGRVAAVPRRNLHRLEGRRRLPSDRASAARLLARLCRRPYQNIPVFEHRCYSATPGRYLFRLGLDASRLAAGSHRLEVRVTDIRRNSSVSSWPLRIARADAPAR